MQDYKIRYDKIGTISVDFTKLTNQLIYKLIEIDDNFNEKFKYYYNESPNLVMHIYEKYAKTSGIDYDTLYNNMDNFKIKDIFDEFDPYQILDFIEVFLNKHNWIEVLSYYYKKDLTDYVIVRLNEEHKEVVDIINTLLGKINYKYSIYSETIIESYNEYLNTSIDNAENNLFNLAEFQYASDEFRSSYKAIINNDFEGCIININKALESVLKVVCINLGYTNSNNEKMGTYFNLLRTNQFYGDINFLDNHLIKLIQSMESGLPTIRNNRSGHGQGVIPHANTKELTEYAFFSGINAINLIIKIYKENIKINGYNK